MSRIRRCFGIRAAVAGALLCGAAGLGLAGVGQSLAPADLTDFKTPSTAQVYRPDNFSRNSPSRTGYLGITTSMGADNRLVVAGVAPDSPASKSGVKAKDILVRVDDQSVATPDALRQKIQNRTPGDSMKLTLSRDGEPVEMVAKLSALGSVGRPLERIRLGVRTGGIRTEGGVRILELDADSRGARAGLQTDDILLKINGRSIIDESTIPSELLVGIPPLETIKVVADRNGKEMEFSVQLASSDGPERPANNTRRGGFGGRGASRANPNVLRVAIIGIEYPDTKHNPKVTTNDWQNEFFSTNSYRNSVTGQAAHGSIYDYFLEQSGGAAKVQGRMFDWVEVSKNRMDYSPQTTNSSGGGRGGGEYRDGTLLNEALDKLTERDGRGALSNYDAVVFLYAGRTAARNSTNVYWPHSSGINFEGRRLRYVLTSEGGERMSDISVLCHELGHVFGLPDLYLRRQQPVPSPSVSTNPAVVTISRPPPPQGRSSSNPYAESLGNWDLMAMQTGSGRPQHLSAWSKEQLGWVKPTVIDPAVRQKLVLGPIENSTNECFKIPLRPDGSEYLLLENRRRVGFDVTVPAEGLLIWRVIYGRPVLEEAHGQTGPNAARIDAGRIPYPNDKNDAFTPFSKPSSAALSGDGVPIYITNIRRLPDGKVSFWVGYGYD